MNPFCLPAGHNQTTVTYLTHSAKQTCRVGFGLRVVHPTRLFELPVVQTRYTLTTPVKVTLGTMMFTTNTEVHREGQPVVRARELLGDGAERANMIAVAGAPKMTIGMMVRMMFPTDAEAYHDEGRGAERVNTDRHRSPKMTRTTTVWVSGGYQNGIYLGSVAYQLFVKDVPDTEWIYR